MKIGFIGVGAMAKAIIQGLLNSKFISSEDILVHSAHKDNYENYAKKFDLTSASSNTELVQKSDYIILAVIPAVVKPVLEEVRTSLNRKVLLSIASGISLARLEELTDYNLPILRCLPNVNSEFGQGMTAVAANENLVGEQKKTALNIFEATGVVLNLPEDKFANFSAISGSAVAYVDLFIDCLSRAGVKYGFSKKDATNIAAQTTLGSAISLLKSKKTPADMIDTVCSPGGDTIEGILAMEQAGMLNSVVKGIDATIKKSTGK